MNMMKLKTTYQQIWNVVDTIGKERIAKLEKLKVASAAHGDLAEMDRVTYGLFEVDRFQRRMKKAISLAAKKQRNEEKDNA